MIKLSDIINFLLGVLSVVLLVIFISIVDDLPTWLLAIITIVIWTLFVWKIIADRKLQEEDEVDLYILSNGMWHATDGSRRVIPFSEEDPVYTMINKNNYKDDDEY